MRHQQLLLFIPGTHDMEGIKIVGQDATFDSNFCWVWWPGKSSKDADCIDGKTGFVINNNDTIYDRSSDELAFAPTFSEVSTFALLKINMEILESTGSSVAKSWRRKSNSNDCNYSLAEIRSLKRQLSSQYELAKDDLLHHRVFRRWSCRDCRA